MTCRQRGFCDSLTGLRQHHKPLLLEGRFGDMAQLLAPVNTDSVAGIALDLGVSSTQLDMPERGFSFRSDGPLDMRMSGAGQSAADLVAARGSWVKRTSAGPKQALMDLL